MDRMEAIENTELAKATRSPQGQIIAERIESVLGGKLEALVMNPELSVDQRMKLSIECAAIGELLKEFDGRIKAAISLASRQMARQSMHVPNR